jgi:LysM repeat protein
MKSRRVLIWSTVGLVVVLAVAGCTCQKPQLPGVTPTPVGGAEAAPEEEMPDQTAIFKTAQANSATAQAARDAATAVPPTSPELTPTAPPPTVVPTAAPTQVPTVAPAPTTPPGGGMVTYVVQRGDTLYSLARRYGTTVEAIASANGIANPNQIKVGQTLKIPTSGSPIPSPAGETYVVQPGDNLFRIALRYGISYTYLARYNGIADPSRIYVGQVLKIPPR